MSDIEIRLELIKAAIAAGWTPEQVLSSITAVSELVRPMSRAGSQPGTEQTA